LLQSAQVPNQCCTGFMHIAAAASSKWIDRWDLYFKEESLQQSIRSSN